MQAKVFNPLIFIEQEPQMPWKGRKVLHVYKHNNIHAVYLLQM